MGREVDGTAVMYVEARVLTGRLRGVAGLRTYVGWVQVGGAWKGKRRRKGFEQREG